MKTVKRPTPVIVSKNFYNPSEECWKQQVLKVEQIQKITKGEGAVMCFIDDGVGINNELQTIEGNKAVNRVQNPVYSYLESGGFHGEHSTNGATIVGGNTLGIFPKMQFISKQVLDPVTGVGPMNAVVSAINKATELNIKCINLSLGSDDYDKGLDLALRKYCADGKRIATVAAGNDASTTDWPAQLAKSIKGVLSVAATQIDEKGNVTIALFSSHGVISIAAPGHALKTMTLENRIDYVSGTSFAAPIVGATIAVAQSLWPQITQDHILHYLKETSDPIPRTSSLRQGVGCIDILSFLMKVIRKDSAPIQKIKKNGLFDFLKELI